MKNSYYGHYPNGATYTITKTDEGLFNLSLYSRHCTPTFKPGFSSLEEAMGWMEWMISYPTARARAAREKYLLEEGKTAICLSFCTPR